jgi:hypothetical protein
MLIQPIDYSLAAWFAVGASLSVLAEFPDSCGNPVPQCVCASLPCFSTSV